MHKINEKAAAQLAWHDLSSFLFLLKNFMLHFLIYFFSIFSHIDPYYFMSYNGSPTPSSSFSTSDLLTSRMSFKSTLASYFLLLVRPGFTDVVVHFWCTWLIGPLRGMTYSPLPLPSSSLPSARSQQLPHGSQQEDTLLVTAPLRKKEKKAEHLQSVAWRRLGIKSWNNPAHLPETKSILSLLWPSFDWAQKSVKAKW